MESFRPAEHGNDWHELRVNPANAMRRHALLVLACPRSGATAVAAAVAKAGAHAGRAFVSAASGDVEETFQAASVCALNERLLGSLGLRWDTLVAPPERWRERPQLRELVNDADALIANDFGSAAQIVLNDPRLAITAPFWRDRLVEAGIDVGAVIVVRRPVEVAASLARHEPCAPEKSLALWLHYLVQAERATRNAPRVLVTYDRLLDAPVGVLSHILTETRSLLKLDRVAREAALMAIRPDLKHFGEVRSLATRALSSGIDAVLDEGYARLAELPPGSDPKRTIESIVQAASPSLTQAIPPWLAHELAVARAEGERRFDALTDAQREIAALKEEIAQHHDTNAGRAENETKLKARIDELARARSEDDRVAHIDASLLKLAADVDRITFALTDQPAREQSLRLELSEAQRDLEDERSAISKLSQSLEEERLSSQANANQLNVMQTHLATAVTEVEQLRVAEAAWTAHNLQLTDELDGIRTSLLTLESERDTLRRERDHAATELARASADLESARTDLKILDHDRNALAARAQAVGDAANALREELARRAAAEAELVAERGRLTAEIRNHADRVNVLERELSRRAAELTTVTGRHEVASKKLAELQQSWIGRKALAGTQRGRA
ncbi:MAG TPA: hypothetical protein VNG69_09710 [Casimicrobiaceae bacterium]|nr:hypothetical protein [Casimicrobiaceae bacterium]